MSNNNDNSNEATTTPTSTLLPARGNAGGDGVFFFACRVQLGLPPVPFDHRWVTWRMRRGLRLFSVWGVHAANPGHTWHWAALWLCEARRTPKSDPCPQRFLGGAGQSQEPPCTCGRCGDGRAAESSQLPPVPSAAVQGADGERRPYRLCSVIVGALAPGQKSPPVFASKGGRRWATSQQARLVAAQENERSPLLMLTGVACDDRVVWTPMGWPEGDQYRKVELIGGAE